jgi:hypothetical protein
MNARAHFSTLGVHRNANLYLLAAFYLRTPFARIANVTPKHRAYFLGMSANNLPERLCGCLAICFLAIY